MGVASRGTAGVTTARCKKGKACGATCIAGNEDCIIDFPMPIQNELRRMAKFLMDKQGVAGSGDAEAQQRFLQETELGKAAVRVGKQLTDETVRVRGSGERKREEVERRFGTTGYGQQRMLSNKEIENLKANVDKIAGTETDEVLRQAWQRDVTNRGVQLPRKDLEALYDSLPQAAKGQLDKTGSPGSNNFYQGVDANGKPITNGKSGNKERGLAVLDLYMRQGGTDAYQLTGKGAGRVFSPADLDVEHIKPMQTKAGGGGKDEPGNWVLARSGAQRTRSNTFYKDFINDLPDPKDKAAMAEYYSDFRKRAAAKRAADKIGGDIKKNKDKYSDEEFLNMVRLVKPGKNVAGDYKAVAVAKKIFRSEDGSQDGFFTGSVLKNPLASSTDRNKYVPQPAGWAKAYLLVRKNNDDATAKEVRAEIRNIWDKQWAGGSLSTKEMTDKIADVYKSKLSPQSWKLVEGEFNKGSQTILSKYGNIAKPAASASPTPRAGTPAKGPGKQTGGRLTQAQAEKEMDSLLASLRAGPPPTPTGPSKVGEGTPRRVPKASGNRTSTAPPAKTSSDRVAAQRAGVQAMINNFRGQGMSDAQIQAQLRTLKVPGPLIAELLT
jgi:hypothetical protein